MARVIVRQIVPLGKAMEGADRGTFAIARNFQFCAWNFGLASLGQRTILIRTELGRTVISSL